MANVKNLLLMEGLADRLEEDKLNHIHGEASLKNLVLSDVYFRDKGFGLLEVTGDSLRNKLTEEASPIDSITVMTYTIKKKFSGDVLNILSKAHSKTAITVVFCHRNVKKTKDINNIANAFNKIFEVNGNITINVIANKSTHIKMLQIDDSLFIGSMNFSSTADAVDENTHNYPLESYYHHEVLFHFNQGGKQFSNNLAKKIAKLDDSISFSVSKDNFTSVIQSHLQYSDMATIDKDRARKRLLINKRMDEVKKFTPELIRQQLSLTFREILEIDDYLKVDSHEISSDEINKIVNFFCFNDGCNKFTTSIVDGQSSKFISVNLSSLCDENEDEDEDDMKDELAFDFKIDLCQIIEDNKETYLDDLIINDDKIKDIIILERYDGDDGEDIPWGELSETHYEEYQESNKQQVFEFINCLLDDLRDYIYENEHYNISAWV